ncbi:MAG: XRE family transcriptional regulator [Nitrococcus sp.]|nr:XRE family transcriptional regulator [Nitrococcus sp.]
MQTLIFVGSSRDDICGFPEAARREVGKQLLRLQHGRQPDNWKPMKTVGKGVRELRIGVEGQFRAFYVTHIGNAVYVLHASAKRGRKPARRTLPSGGSGSSSLESDMAEKMTVSCGNVFEDLGFAPDEAAAMQARETLLIALEKELRKRGKKQQELADELGIPRTRISEVFNHKTDRFSADKLVRLLHRAGKRVEIRVA